MLTLTALVTPPEAGLDWSLFWSTFGLIFLAELPDKTAFAVLLMSTNSNAFGVFAGASLAFIVQCIVAVAFGALFRFLPPQIVHIGAAAMFLVFAVLMWRRKETEESDEAKAEAKRAATFFKSVATAFLVIFVAEWGDLTQLATVALVAKYEAQALTIFLAAVASLVTVTGIGALVGHHTARFINAQVLQKVAAVAMALAGVYMLVEALRTV